MATAEQLRRQREQASIFSRIYDAAAAQRAALASEGRRPVLGGLLSKEPVQGVDTLRYEGVGNMLMGLLDPAARAIDAPAAAARGQIPREDMLAEALGTAGFAMLGGGAIAKPAGSLGAFYGREGGSVKDAVDLAKSGRGIFHSSQADQFDEINKYGVEPQYGPWVKEIAAGATDDPSFLDEMPMAAWWSDQPDWVKMKTARAAGKNVRDVTIDDVRKYGHLSIADADEYADTVYRIPEEGIDYEGSEVSNLSGERMPLYATDLYEYGDDGVGRYPFGIERNELVTRESVEPKYSLTGQDLVDFLEQYEGNTLSANASKSAGLASMIGFDNPKGDWLAGKVRRAEQNIAEGGKGIVGPTTAYTKQSVMLPIDQLSTLKGAMDEMPRAGQPKYDDLMQSMRSEGFRNDSPVLVGVNHRGEPYIVEGNNRVAVAREMGIDKIPVEVRWYNGGEDASQNWSPQSVQDMAMANASKSAGALTLASDVGDAPMIVHHNLRPEALQMYSETGGMPMPSIAISNANFPLERFGDISLVMKPEKIKPSASMPVFPTDAFTGRAPRIDIEDGQRVLYPEDPYTPSGSRRKPKPYSVEEAFRRMKKNRAYEAGSEQHAGSGQIRAVLSDKFKSMSDIKKNRGLLVPDDNEFADVKGTWDNLVWDSVNDLANQHFDGRFRVAEDYMTDLVMGRNTSWANASPEARDATRSVISNLRKEVQGMPTEYFEAKPKKILQVADFDAAVVPSGDDASLDLLRRAGIEDVRVYDPNKSRASEISEMNEYFFSNASPVGGLLTLQSGDNEQKVRSYLRQRGLLD
jgi:hypothetical protein